MAIAALTVDINARLAGIEGDLGKVSRLAEQSAAKMSRAFDAVGESLRNVFAGVAIGSIASGFGRLVTEALDAQDALSDLSKSTAISIELLAGLKGAAITSGTDLEGVAAAVNKLSVNIGKNAEQFAAVGITAREPLEALKQLADVYAAIEDPQMRAAFAAEAVSKSWASLAPLLSDGGQSIGDLINKFRDVSGVTEKSAQAAAELNGRLDVLKARVSGAAGELTNSLVPSLTRTAESVEQLAAKGEGLAAVFRGLIGLAKIPFDLALGDIDPSKAGQIKTLEEQLANLERRAKNAKESGGGIINNLVFGKPGDLDKEIAGVRGQLEAIRQFGKDKAGSKTDESAEGKKAPSEIALKAFIGGGERDRTSRSGGRTAKAIDDGTRLVEQLRDQIRATQELTEVEKLELAIADGKYRTATAANLAIARGYAETLDNIKAARAEAEKEAEAQRERLELFAEGARVFESVRTPTEALNAELDRLVTLLDAGAINMETFGRAASRAGEEMQRLESKGEDTTDLLDEFAKNAAQNMQTSFANFLFDPFADGTKSMLQAFGDMIRRMIAEAVAADLIRRLFGDLGKGSGSGGGGGSSGLIGSFLDTLSGLLPSFDVGIPYVPRDMLAVVHKGERITPAAQNRPGGGQNISVIINMGSGSSGGDLRQAAGEIARRIGQTVAGAARYA
jgi:hypothetical protein